MKTFEEAKSGFHAILLIILLLFVFFLPACTEDREIEENTEEVKQENFTFNELEEGVYKRVDEMPHFPGCEDIVDTKKKLICADQKLVDFISSNIQYPEEALSRGIEGHVIVQFIVRKDGRIDGIQIVKGKGYGLDKEARRVLQLMQENNIRWIPGHEEGTPVDVRFTLPVRFTLEEDLEE